MIALQFAARENLISLALRFLPTWANIRLAESSCLLTLAFYEVAAAAPGAAMGSLRRHIGVPTGLVGTPSVQVPDAARH